MANVQGETSIVKHWEKTITAHVTDERLIFIS